MATDSIPNRLLEQSNLRPSAPAYYVRDNGVWRATSWGTYSDQVKQAGRALMTLGFSSGDTTTILGFNRPEWVVLNVATMGAGGACAGIYTTCSPEEVAYIINHCEARFILVENEQQWEKVKHEREAGNLQKLEHVITMKGAPTIDDDMVMTWEEFLAKGDETDESGYLDRVKALQPDDLATFIYTSGTTGPPKGVMLSHYNLTWTATGACTINDLSSEDVSLSYLPLSHIAEQMFTVHAPITVGSRVYFAESIDAVPENLKEVQPTVFFGVPRIWEKFYAGINSKLKLATGPKAKLVQWAQSIGREANLSPNGHKGLRYKLANKLIFSKLKPAVGLARARICVSGAAPISQEILEFFASLDIVIYEVYGQSEDTGPTSFNMPGKYKFGSVGPAFPGVEVKIAEDGEILVKGPNVFQGYFKDEAATNEALIDGWLHSGDLGEFKGEFLYITGRKKDIIITAGGKNIAPKNIEAALKNHELINEAVVIGDRRKYLTALVTLDPEAAEAWAKQNGVAVDGMNENDTLRAEIQKCVNEVNSHFARVEQLKKFKVLHRNLTVEDGELTPTLKVKRKKVNEHFADDIESLYT